MPPKDKLASRTAAKGGQKLVDMGDGRIVDFTGYSDQQIENLVRNEKPTQFEQRINASKPGFLSHVGSAAKNVGAGLLEGVPGSPGGIAGNAVKMGPQVAQDDLNRRMEGRSLAYRIGAPAAQQVVPGLNPRAMEEAANVGDTGGVLGEAAVPAALAVAPLAGEGIARGAQAARPLAARIAPGAGAAAGYAVGHWPGLIIGRELGQGLKGVLTPPKEVPAPPVKTSPFEGATPTNAPIGSAKLPPAPTGPQDPFTLTSGKPAPSVKPVPPSPFAGATSSANPQWTGELPQPTSPQQPFTLGQRITNAQGGAPSPKGVAGSVGAPNDRLVLLPEEAQAESQMNQLAARRASQRGTYYAGEMRPPGTTGPGAKPVNRVPKQSTPTSTPFANRVPTGDNATLSQRTQSQSLLSPEEKDIMNRTRQGQPQEPHDE